MNDPILITGCARSGTSMTAGILDICGAYGGLCSGPNVRNVKGMYENAVIRDHVVKPYLKDVLHSDPRGQYPLPDPCMVFPVLPDFALTIKTIIQNQGYISGEWYYKCAKACLFWQVWEDAFPNIKWILVRRNDEDIINSCLHTGFMRAYKTKDGWQHWVNYHKDRFAEMRVACRSIVEIWPTTFVNGDLTHIRKVVEDFGLIWREDKVIEFIEPALFSGRKSNVKQG